MLEIQKQPAQIRKFICGPAKIQIALPEISMMHKDDRISPVLHVRGNIYCSLPLPIGYSRHRFLREDYFEKHWNFDLMKNPKYDFMERFFINPQIQITSFMHWHALTRKYPDFMTNEFDILSYIRLNDQVSGIYWSDESHRFPGWMITDQFANPCEVRRLGQRHRSIQLDFGNDCENLMLRDVWFPEIALVLFRENTFLCLRRLREDTYVPLQFANIDLFGAPCMRSDDPFDFFWNSSFTSILVNGLKINPGFSIYSLHGLKNAIVDNPGFMIDQFDPDYAEQQSPIVYTIKDDQISWEFF